MTKKSKHTQNKAIQAKELSDKELKGISGGYVETVTVDVDNMNTETFKIYLKQAGVDVSRLDAHALRYIAESAIVCAEKNI